VIHLPDLNFSALLPIVLVAIGAMAILMGEVLLSRADSVLGREVTESFIGTVLAATAIFFLALTLYVSGVAFASGGVQVFNPDHPMYQLDPFSSLVTAVVALSALLSCALSIAYLSELRINHGEYYALIMLSVCGMMLMIAAVDLIAVFLGLELMSIPIYVLAGFDRRKLRSNESALKYFLIGSFASAILLYGMALLYGVSGATSFEAIRAGFDAENPIALVGLGFVVVGFAFKISMVPFHQWTPDVYEGAPSAVTAFMSVTVKIAAFAALIRLLAMAFDPLDESLEGIFWVLSALTIVVGNIMAIIQDNVKRMLAYSSIGQMGYIMLGIAIGTPLALTGALLHVVNHAVMKGCLFMVVNGVQWRVGVFRVRDFAGMGRRLPWTMAAFTVAALSMIGLPPTAGFLSKYYLALAALESGYIPFLAALVLSSLLGAVYFFRVLEKAYLSPENDETTRERSELPLPMLAPILTLAMLVLLLGVFNQTVVTVLIRPGLPS